MSAIDFISGGLISSLAVLIIIFYMLFKYPEKVERWLSMFLKVFSYISKKVEKKRIETYINSNIEIGRKKLETEVPGSMPFGMRIEFINTEKDETYQKDGTLIIKMKNHKNDSENLAKAVMYYVSQGLLPYSKKYIDDKVSKGIDFVISKDMLKTDHIAVTHLQKMFNEFLSNDDSKEVVDKIETIHEEGFLTRICMREFQKFGQLFPREPEKDIKEESKNFLETIFKFVTKKRDENVNLGFKGHLIKLRIVPLISRHQYGIDNHYNFISHSIKDGWENFYIVAAGRNIENGKKLVYLITNDVHLNLKEEFRDIYYAKYRGKEMKIFVSFLKKVEINR